MQFLHWLQNLNVVSRTSRRTRPTQNAALEQLEQRTLPAISVLLVGGNELNISSDDGDAIRVRSLGGNVSVETASSASGLLLPDTSIGIVPAANIQSIIINGGDQENTIDLSGVTAADFPNVSLIEVRGHHGDDTIIGSPDLANNLFGDDGADTITTGSGNDVVDGGDGADSLTTGAGDDSVLGGDGSDAIATGDGNDTVNAGNGQDTVSLGNGDDSVFAGNGEDLVLGEAGNDTLNGDGGIDTVNGGDGDDSILGGEFADVLNGDAGNDFINGQGGNDSVDGGVGDDTLFGAAGHDSLIGNFGDDSIQGQADNDTIQAGDGDDTVLGGAGRDSINGDSGNDVLKGQGGNDTLTGGGGADLVDGGDGDDFVRTFEPNAVALPSVSINDGSRVEGNPASPFGLTQSFDTGVTFQRAITSNDFDGDGDVDVVVVGSFTGTNQARVMLNNGSGSFTQGGFLPSSGSQFTPFFTDAASADLDGDGDNDIAIVDSNNDETLVYLNNGDATFAAPVRLPVNTIFTNIQAIVAADLDGDGDQDLATANGFSNSISIFINDGSANFSRADLSIGSAFIFADVNDIVADDLDNDGDIDLAVSMDDFFTAGEDMAVILNFGGGAFAVSSTLDFLPTSFNLDEIVTLDFDNDGDQDLAIGDNFNDQVHLLRNDGGGGYTFLSTLQTSTFAGNIYLTSGDFNLDGIDDLISVSDTFTGAINIFFSNGDGTFQNRVDVNLPNFTNVGGPVVATDLNGDAALDLAIAGEFGNTLFVLLNSTPSNIPQVTLTITLSQPTTVPVTVSFGTSDGSASGGTDYLPTSGIVTFAPGETAKNINVRTRVDNTPEQTENFFVTLTSATNAVIADGQAQVALIDDDGGAAVPQLSIDNVTLNPEGNGGITSATFTVTLTGTTTNTVTVDFATADVTAVAGSDYTAASGQLTFAPGTTTQTITVPVFGDGRFEPTESFVVNLSNPTNAIFLVSRGTATIFDDDAVPGNTTLVGGNGNDTLLGAEGNEFLNGGLGNDLINAGDGVDTLLGGGGNDTLNGEAGDDSINGQGGNDELNGGEGDDTLTWQGGANGHDTAIGGNGFDTLLVFGDNTANAFVVSASAAGKLVVSEGAGSATAESDIRCVSIQGNGGDDTVTVTGNLSSVAATKLVIAGGDGNDSLGGVGAILGNVRLELNGGTGNDTIAGTSGNDTLLGGNGNDFIVGNAGNDTVDGGAGDDTLKGSAGNDVLRGGDGNDSLEGEAGNDLIIGGDGSDTALGGDGNDSLQGQLGNDLLNGQAGNDSLEGGVGQDSLLGGVGDDTLDGGRNDDILNGQAGNDKIRGDHGADSITGGDGDDTINGGDGDDTINSGLGNDLINGGDGDDRVNADGGDDTIAGGDGKDLLLGGGGNDIVLGEDGEDTINGQAGTDTVAGGQGVDVISDPASEINEQFVLSLAIQAALSAL